MGLLLYFGIRKCYPELYTYRVSVSGVTLDVLVGIAGATLWMAPHLFFGSFESLVPSTNQGFDAQQIGASSGWLALSLRIIGFGLVTPFIEELFVRSWLQRYADVFDKSANFRDVSIAHFSGRSFVLVVVWFTFSHQTWEWPVAAAWVLMTQFWFYHRKNFVALVIVHAITNLTIFAVVVFADAMLHDTAGRHHSGFFYKLDGRLTITFSLSPVNVVANVANLSEAGLKHAPSGTNFAETGSPYQINATQRSLLPNPSFLLLTFFNICAYAQKLACTPNSVRSPTCH